jgi:hypothetical protein
METGLERLLLHYRQWVAWQALTQHSLAQVPRLQGPDRPPATVTILEQHLQRRRLLRQRLVYLLGQYKQGRQQQE